MLTRVYRKGVLEAEGFDPARISDYLAEPDTVVWLDVCCPTPVDLELVAEELGLHPLAQEDAVGRPQRPKLEPYAGHQFLVGYAARFDPATRRLRTVEVDVFFDRRWLLTVRKDAAFEVGPVLARWDAAPELARHGVAFLLQGLLDELVDGHFAVVEQLDEAVDALEEEMFASAPGTHLQRQTYELRKALVELRRIALPMREVVNGLLVRNVCEIDEVLRPYFQDVYDHVLRVSDWTDSLRDLVASLTETYLTLQGNRLNEIMKRLTGYAAIVAVPTAVAGVYGMNTRLYPGAGTVAGWWVALGTMTAISAGLFVYFRRKDWL